MPNKQVAQGLLAICVIVGVFWNDVSVRTMQVLALSANSIIVSTAPTPNNISTAPTPNNTVLVDSSMEPASTALTLFKTHTMTARERCHELLQLEAQRRQSVSHVYREAMSKMHSQHRHKQMKCLQKLQLQSKNSVAKPNTAALLWQAALNLRQLVQDTVNDIETHLAYVLLLFLNTAHDCFRWVFTGKKMGPLGKMQVHGALAPVKTLVTVCTLFSATTGNAFRTIYALIDEKAATREPDGALASVSVTIIMCWVFYGVFVKVRELLATKRHQKELAKYYESRQDVVYLYWKLYVPRMDTFDEPCDISPSIVLLGNIYAAEAALSDNRTEPDTLTELEKASLRGLHVLRSKLQDVKCFHEKYPWRKPGEVWWCAQMAVRALQQKHPFMRQCLRDELLKLDSEIGEAKDKYINRHVNVAEDRHVTVSAPVTAQA